MDKRNVEAIFPLSPMQQALLFSSLHAGDTDPGFLQLRCTLHGDLDVAIYERAWQRVVDCHQMLRASIHWKELEQPLHVVFRQVSVSWTHEDWRELSEAEQLARLHDFLRADRKRGFDLSQVLVMRLALFQMAEGRWQFVWSCHHVLLDGWSGALVLRDVSTCYEAFRRGSDLPIPAPPLYRDYVVWLRQQDLSVAEAFWRQTLAGITAPTPLPFDQSGASNGQRRDFDEKEVKLTREATAAIVGFAKRHRLTLSTVVHGAWALLLSSYSGSTEVVFGTTVSGRSAEVPGVDTMVGLFINTLPVRVVLSRDNRTISFLEQLQVHQATLRAYEDTPPGQIHAWSEMPGHQRLFDSLVVIENYPLDTLSQSENKHLEVSEFHGGITTNYPLTVVVGPGETLSLHIIYDARRFANNAIEHILNQLRVLFERMVSEPESCVGDLLDASEWEAGRSRSVTIRTGGAEQTSPSPYRTGYVAPRNALELKLTKAWEKVLGVQPIGIRDDFFDLGGHSLLAARLFEEIERAFGKKLPLATLFELSTIEALADVMQDEEWAPSWTSLVPMQTQGSRLPLFCVHSWEGNVLFYRDLARYLAPDQPVYALQAVGLDGHSPPLRRVEDMAAQYLHEIRTVQPEGPYFLAGMCFGIAVAFEMAHQLRAQDQQVGALIVLDSIFTHRKSRWNFDSPPRTSEQYARRIVDHLQRPDFIPAMQAYVVRRTKRLTNRLRKAITRRYRGWYTSVVLHYGSPERQHALHFEEALRSAWHSYEPEPFPGRLTIIVSSKFAPRVDWDREWADLAPEGFAMYEVPGKHLTFLQEPHVSALATQIRSCLDAARA